ncbi:MAG: nuclear transport factor 2 family protein [Planctomyces sp.]|nr:nuclear transport factor 2 family protein [Planctomyces sp.]
MTLALPQPIADYFTADAVDGGDVSQCFTDDAVVKDEGHAYHGRAAIRQWKANVSTKYQYTCEPLACQQSNGEAVVTCRLVGNFPGSPVKLRFFFELKGDKIASLEVTP